MPRQILPEGQEGKEDQSQIQGSAIEETSFGFASLSADELDKLFHEWDASGKNDLLVEPDLANRVREYLAHQKELDALRIELAERIYKPFVVSSNGSLVTYYNICIGDFQILYHANFFHANNMDGENACAISISHFKTVALALGISQASYIPEDTNVRVNLFAFLVSIGKKWDNTGFSIKIKS